MSDNLNYGPYRYEYDFFGLLPTSSILKNIFQMLFKYRFYDFTLVTDADFDFKR